MESDPEAAPDRLSREQAGLITDPGILIDLLGLDAALKPAATRSAEQFGFRVTRSFASRMRRGDPDDPLLRQVLPIEAEMLDGPTGFGDDPTGDLEARAAPGVLQKYRGRVLLIVTGTCAVHCRYCFRRHFPYGEETRAHSLETALDYLNRNDTVREVILSGGDPLTLSDRRLGGLAGELGRIPHLVRLRLHTRQPVVDPGRVGDDLLAWLESTDLRTTLVIHANHPAEIDDDVARAADRLRRAGVTLLNQSVLLRGVNDRAETLSALSERLFSIGVLPYYLHALDRVRGAAHFLVPEDKALALHRELRASLPGYLVPRLAREDPGRACKTLLV